MMSDGFAFAHNVDGMGWYDGTDVAPSFPSHPIRTLSYDGTVCHSNITRLQP